MAFRIGDRVTVSYATHTGTWTGIITDACTHWVATTYTVHPDGADADHPGYTACEAQLTAHTYADGDLVLFAGAGGHVATVRNPDRYNGQDGYTIDVYGGDAWFTTPDKLIPLPAGTLLLQLGDEVKVADDAPLYAGSTGVVATPGFQDRQFGYWVYFNGTPEWVPAVALHPAEAGERR